MENKYEFSSWSTERRYRALIIMDRYIQRNGDITGYMKDWKEYGGGSTGEPESTKAKRMEIAKDDTKFINALFCFYICTTTFFSMNMDIGDEM